MNLSKNFAGAMRFVSEAVARIFSPNDDRYPTVGVQPFEGDPMKANKRLD